MVDSNDMWQKITRRKSMKLNNGSFRGLEGVKIE